jgi:hypothetical protein
MEPWSDVGVAVQLGGYSLTTGDAENPYHVPLASSFYIVDGVFEMRTCRFWSKVLQESAERL